MLMAVILIFKCTEGGVGEGGRWGRRSRRSYGKIGEYEQSTLFMAKSTRSLGLVFHGNEANESSLNTATSIYVFALFLFNTKKRVFPF